MLLSLLVSVIVGVPGPMDFYADGPYDSSVPRPETLLHYGPGERITNYRDQERVILGIAEKAKARVKVIEFGQSVERRPLRVIAISSPQNIDRLEEIRKDHAAIAMGVADEATVKTFYRESDRIRLQPENAALAPIYAANVAILGRVVGVFREL